MEWRAGQERPKVSEGGRMKTSCGEHGKVVLFIGCVAAALLGVLLAGGRALSQDAQKAKKEVRDTGDAKKEKEVRDTLEAIAAATRRTSELAFKKLKEKRLPAGVKLEDLPPPLSQEEVAALGRELDKYFDEDVTVIDGSGFTRGWANYRDKNLLPQMLTIRKGNNHALSNMNVKMSGDTAWATYQYTLDADVAGKAHKIVGFGTAVLRQKGASWKVVHSMTSGRVAPTTVPRTP